MIKKKEVYTAREDYLCELISEHYGISFDSIVAEEELGNEVWCTHVMCGDWMDKETVDGAITSGNFIYTTGCFLNCLCAAGKIPAGDYEIDCTW